jgi:hypothetical protein
LRKMQELFCQVYVNEKGIVNGFSWVRVVFITVLKV